MDAMTPPDMLSPISPVQQMAAIPKDPPKPTTHDVKIVTTKKLAQARAMGIPPEEFGIERGARDIPTCNYCFHETSKSVGELTAQGFDKKQLNDITTTAADNTETIARDSVEEHSPQHDTLNLSARMVRVTEHYIRMDYEGTGRACIYRVTTGGEGGSILKRDGKEDIERVDVTRLRRQRRFRLRIGSLGGRLLTL